MLKVFVVKIQIFFLILIYIFFQTALNSPTRPVGKYNVALFSCPLCEYHTCVFLPVAHCLTKYGALAA